MPAPIVPLGRGERSAVGQGPEFTRLGWVPEYLFIDRSTGSGGCSRLGWFEFDYWVVRCGWFLFLALGTTRIGSS